MDYFMDNDNISNRLIDEWLKHGEIIIAYDFDNTVYDYHSKGYTFDKVIWLLQKCKETGAKFIVFTCCGEEKYPFIREYLESNNIPYDTINENLPETDFGGRKVYYNILLDDRAGLGQAYQCLFKARMHVIYNRKKMRQGED